MLIKDKALRYTGNVIQYIVMIIDSKEKKKLFLYNNSRFKSKEYK